MTMKFPQETLNYFQGKIKSFSIADVRTFCLNGISSIQTRVKGLSVKKSAIGIQRSLTATINRNRERGFKGTVIALQKKNG